MIEEKAALRVDLRARRAAFVARMSRDERSAIEHSVSTRLASRLDDTAAVAAYIAIGDEIDPAALLAGAAQAGRITALPHVTTRDRPMRFLVWRPGDALVPGPMGLLQPEADALPVNPHVILTPLLGFDDALNRIGQGAGYYDRAFAEHPRARRIGLAWSVQRIENLPVDTWDVPLHAIATERAWIEKEPQ